jgi:hypothetical protein
LSRPARISKSASSIRVAFLPRDDETWRPGLIQALNKMKCLAPIMLLTFLLAGCSKRGADPLLAAGERAIVGVYKLDNLLLSPGRLVRPRQPDQCLHPQQRCEYRSSAFRECTRLANLTIPNSVTNTLDRMSCQSDFIEWMDD